jgi:hypothetical protein
VRKLIKIVLGALLILLVVFAVFADLPAGKAFLAGYLDLALYLKMISLLGMLIALFLSMGYKHRVDASQKYRRANSVQVEAQAKAERHEKILQRMEQNLQKDYAKKEQGLNSQIKEAYAGYEKRLKNLKRQNIELKESLAKVVRALKRERSGHT